MTSQTRDYRHFPPEYDTVLRAFARDGSYVFRFADERDARHTARDLNRYREALRTAAEAEPDNEHVRAMCEICRDVILRCTRDGTATAADLPWHVTLALNPAVASIRAQEARQ